MPLVDASSISMDARSWQRLGIQLDAGTTRLQFAVRNEGKNVGAAAFTQFFLTDLEGNDVC